jgi:hypothetical protein
VDRKLFIGGAGRDGGPPLEVRNKYTGQVEGMRQSGVGREGVRYAMEEMTNIQMVAIRLT